MKLLIVNPNISESVTALIEAEARRSIGPDTQITAVTATLGVAYIETRFEALIGAYAVAQQVAEHVAGHDGVVVAAFGDPGLNALREALPVPVTGMTEAAMATACQLGSRFSIVSISPRMRGWYLDTVHNSHLSSRLASFRALQQAPSNVATVQTEQAERLVEIAHQCVREDGADVIILAGAPLAGLARTIQHRLPVPAVDGVSCAVRQIEALVRMQPAKATAGSYAGVPTKPNQGLTPALQSFIAQASPSS